MLLKLEIQLSFVILIVMCLVTLLGLNLLGALCSFLNQ